MSSGGSSSSSGDGSGAPKSMAPPGPAEPMAAVLKPESTMGGMSPQTTMFMMVLVRLVVAAALILPGVFAIVTASYNTGTHFGSAHDWAIGVTVAVGLAGILAARAVYLKEYGFALYPQVLCFASYAVATGFAWRLYDDDLSSTTAAYSTGFLPVLLAVLGGATSALVWLAGTYVASNGGVVGMMRMILMGAFCRCRATGWLGFMGGADDKTNDAERFVNRTVLRGYAERQCLTCIRYSNDCPCMVASANSAYRCPNCAHGYCSEPHMREDIDRHLAYGCEGAPLAQQMATAGPETAVPIASTASHMGARW